MSVTSREVARLAGVSQATVSRAMRGDPSVSPGTTTKVTAAATALGYIRSEVGRSLRTRSTRQIAMVADLANQLYPSLMPAIHDRLADAGYRLIMLAERPEHSTVASRLLDRSIDGVILTTTLLNATLPGELRRHRVPFVYLNRVTDTVEADSVTVDNAAGAALVGQLLLELGHRRIGAIFSSATTSTGRERERGFRDALAEAGIGLPVSGVHYGWFSYQHGEEGMSKILSAPKRPTAVFCANDFIAVGAMAEAKRQHIRVPADLTVVGFDNLEIASWPWLNLTTVNSPLAQMAENAVDMLLKRLDDDSGATVRQVWPATLVLRSTHAPPPS